MSRRDRRKFTATFKAEVVLEALRERKTISELAQQFDLHPNQISAWKKEFLAGASKVFQEPADPERENLEQEPACGRQARPAVPADRQAAGGEHVLKKAC